MEGGGDERREQETGPFKASDLLRLAGLTYRQLNDWENRAGVLAPASANRPALSLARGAQAGQGVLPAGRGRGVDALQHGEQREGGAEADSSSAYTQPPGLPAPPVRALWTLQH